MARWTATEEGREDTTRFAPSRGGCRNQTISSIFSGLQYIIFQIAISIAKAIAFIFSLYYEQKKNSLSDRPQRIIISQVASKPLKLQILHEFQTTTAIKQMSSKPVLPELKVCSILKVRCRPKSLDQNKVVQLGQKPLSHGIKILLSTRIGFWKMHPSRRRC